MQCCRGEAAKGVWSCWGGRCSAAEERLPRVSAEERLPRECGAAGEGDAVLQRRGCQGCAELLGREMQCCRGEAAKGARSCWEGDALLPRRGCQGCVELLGREMQCCEGEAAKGVWSCWGGRCSAAKERLSRVCGAAGEGDAVLRRRGCQGCVELLGREMQCCEGEAAKGVWSCCGGRCGAAEERLPRVCGAAGEGDALLPRRGCQGSVELLGREMKCCEGEAAKGVRSCCGGTCTPAEERLPRVCGAAGEGDAVLQRRGCQGCAGCWGGRCSAAEEKLSRVCGAAVEGDAVLPKRGCHGSVELLWREMRCCRGEAAKGVWSCWRGRCGAAEERLPRVCGAAVEGDALLPRRGCQGSVELLGREMQCCEGEAAKGVELLGREMQCCRGEAAKGVRSCWGGRCTAAEERLPRVCGAAGEGDAVLRRRGCQGCAELLGREMHCCRGEAAKGVAVAGSCRDSDEFQTAKEILIVITI
ncbi:hypothetical protein NDU88_000033 [Pleurodeles waltl]|uniref:Uncharacterized protein n=1 Tax=Pleurodeles waltl TaxID=8319 RepID=A0AAV7SVA8_PLEWA|nr:hypothetical protein NDU88_000033 [Pleurodeles waltl]